MYSRQKYKKKTDFAPLFLSIESELIHSISVNDMISSFAIKRIHVVKL